MTRLAKCNCRGCNNLGTQKRELARRGNRYAYLCDYHATMLDSYSTENNNRQGTAKVNGFTFSQELETSYSNIDARLELMASGYIATQDATVDVEYKSPITSGLNSLSKHCATIDRLIANGDLSVEDVNRYKVGTHLHVGHVDYINPQTMDYIRRFYHSLFIPLCEKMEADTEKTARFFGRALGGWAIGINSNSWALEHKNFINTEHAYTLEFRICKYRNASQYMAVAKFWRDVVNCLINNFIIHFNEQPKDARRYPTITEYRKHKAQVTANKIVALYEKYTSNL